jgi:hypothetical protein
MEKTATEDIKITAIVNKPPYFRNNKFTIPVEIQYSKDVEIPKSIRAFLNKYKTIKPNKVKNNMKHIENITFDSILPVLLRSRIAFYSSLKGVECPYTTRPVKKIEILDGSDVLGSYESRRTDL